MNTNTAPQNWFPGQILVGQGELDGLVGRESITLIVTNTGDRPVQVGSHFHFFEVNRSLDFDRAEAYGMRLLIPAGTAVRFEPGQSHEVSLVAFGGERVVHGLNGLVNGRLDDDATHRSALAAARSKGFKGVK